MRKLLKRQFRMASAWSILGVLVGWNNGWYMRLDMIGIISQMVAGVIILSFLGCIIGTFFDRPKESLVGGILGAAAGLIFVSCGSASLRGELVGVFIISGGIFFSTCWMYVWVFKKLYYWLQALGV